MKTLQTLALLFAMLLTTAKYVNAGTETADSNSLPEPIQNYIEKTLYEPNVDVAPGKAETVRIKFSVSQDGTVNIIETNASSDAIDREVRQRLSSIIINDVKSFSGKTFTAALKFIMHT